MGGVNIGENIGGMRVGIDSVSGQSLRIHGSSPCGVNELNPPLQSPPGHCDCCPHQSHSFPYENSCAPLPPFFPLSFPFPLIAHDLPPNPFPPLPQSPFPPLPQSPFPLPKSPFPPLPQSPFPLSPFPFPFPPSLLGQSFA